MSTNSRIIVKINKNDLGKTMVFNKKLVTPKISDWSEYGEKPIRRRETPVELNDNYISIYCHWDGYIKGVGNALKKCFNTYEKALNLCLGGNCSYIATDSVRRYHDRASENPSWNLPKQANSVKDIEFEEYTYLFENGHWKVCSDVNESFKTF